MNKSSLCNVATNNSYESFNNLNIEHVTKSVIEGKLPLRKSKITHVFDFFLYLIIIGSAILIAYFLWTKVYWLLAIILAYPIYRVIGYPLILLTAPLYYWLTPENKAWSLFIKDLHEGDTCTASKVKEAIEKWNNCGNCEDLQECCQQYQKSTLLNEDLKT